MIAQRSLHESFCTDDGLCICDLHDDDYILINDSRPVSTLSSMRFRRLLIPYSHLRANGVRRTPPRSSTHDRQNRTDQPTTLYRPTLELPITAASMFQLLPRPALIRRQSVTSCAAAIRRISYCTGKVKTQLFGLRGFCAPLDHFKCSA